MPAADSAVRIGGPSLPPQAWLLAWSSLGAQLLVLAERGFTQADGALVLLSMVIGAAVVGWVSAGVLTGRTVRLAGVWVFLVASLLFYLLGALDGFESSGWQLIHLGVTAIEVLALAAFCRTSYFARQRATPNPAAPMGSILVVALAVGAVGGVIAPQDDAVQRCGSQGHHHRTVHCRDLG